MTMVTTQAGRRFHSPCRPQHPTRPHPCSPEHADTVEAYRLWREHLWKLAESETQLYPTELADYWLTHPRPTFRAYLCGTGRTDRERHAA